MQLEFVGAAQTVTGSKHLIRTKKATILLDFGLFQGRRQESIERNKVLGVNPATIDAVVLSHAHIDHSGALPILAKAGYDGPIYTTPATRDLVAVMLEDSALIQLQDARFINKHIERDGLDMKPVEPLYGPDDVTQVLNCIISVPYHRSITIADGVKLSFIDAGHVLGSAISVLDIEDEGETKRLVFTGDLGRKNMPILRDPELPEGVTALITESTYGDRNHAPIGAMEDELAAVLKRTYERGGKLVIPSFSLERAQELVFYMKRLQGQNRMPKIPVYVDSPLTVKITEIFKLHPECYDAETRALIQGHASPFEFPNLEYVSDKEDSKAIDTSQEPSVIISASGMCEAGRILHHLKATIESEKNTVAIVGFQAPHTLGRRIVERRNRVKIFGVERDLRAEVVVMNGFSAHADQHDLVEFISGIAKTSRLGNIALVHGEPKAQNALTALLEEQCHAKIRAPATGDVIQI